MIKDNLLNAKKYYNLSPEIERGLKFLQENDLKNMKPDRYIIDGENLYVNVEEYETRKSFNIEAHRKYIDIQYIVTGEENIGVTGLKDLKPICDYDENKDIIFYNGNAELNLLKENEFLILYPDDAHLPCQMIKEPKKVKKAVVKVKIK